MSSFPPPRKALLAGVKLAAAIVVPLAAVALIVGGNAVLAAVLGALSAAVMPYVRPKMALVLIVALSLTGFLAVLAAGNVLASVAVIVAACLVAGLASKISAGVFGVAPIVAAILTLDQPKMAALPTALVMLAVGLYVLGVVMLLKMHIEAKPVPWDVAIRHAVVMAMACGVATGVASHYEWPKSYWLVMTLAIVLRPYAAESLTRNKQRILGTLLGAILAVLLSPLPRPWQLAMAAVCMALMFAYLTLQNYVLQVAFMTPMVIFLVSTGTVSDTFYFDGLRVLYTVAACVAGGLVALFLARQESVEPA
jgi:hypothetical protein